MGVGRVAAFAFGLLAAVFFIKLGTPGAVNFSGSSMGRKQKIEQNVHQLKSFGKIVEII